MGTGKRRPAGKWNVCGRLFMLACGLCLSGMMFPFSSYAESYGAWEKTEDGKHWQYVYGPGEPVIDEWIEIDGKEYYLDQNGYMKTGWFVDEWDGNRYYMGEDGAKCKNMFLPDGKFVGPDGVVLTKFEAWRKAVRKELDQLIQAKTSGVFFLTDLNSDGYRDLVVLNSLESPDKTYLTAIWAEEEETLNIVSESSPKEAGRSYMTRNREDQSIWLITEQEDGLEKDYFELGTDEEYFEHRYHFMTENNDWGDLIYYVNGEETDPWEWERIQQEAYTMSGASGGYFPVGIPEAVAWSLDSDSAETALTQIPKAEELLLWQS